MRNIAIPFFAIFFTAAAAVGAETVSVIQGVELEVALPQQGWEMSRSAPEFLLRESLEHLEHELAAQGQTIAPEKLRNAVDKRLGANELFIFKRASGSVLTIDFSPLKAGERPPTKRSLAASARYAGESLAAEEGVEGVKSDIDKFQVDGAGRAYRIQASYRHHGEPRKFTGIIGFLDSYWFFLYYTDPLRDPGDAVEMGEILDSLVLTTE